MDYSRHVNPTIVAAPKPGIRKFFGVAVIMPSAISLGVGEPDFAREF